VDFGSSAGNGADFLVSKAIDRVVVDHPNRLHERVDDGGTHKVESPLFEVAAQRI
jgi:hypothetical protein